MKDFEIFTTIDDKEIENFVNNNLDENLSETLYPGDERRMFANAFIALLCTVFAYLNEKAKLRLLRFAQAETLDYLGERVNCSRLAANKAQTTVKFLLQNPLNIGVVVPKGTRVTPDGVLFFETLSAATIPAGASDIDILTQSTAGGSIYNGYAPGAINTMVDIVPYISGVQNIDVSAGGDDGEPYPLSENHPEGDDGTGDDNYRSRIRKAPASFSTAGPEEAYEYYALSADASVEDVKITSEQDAGRIDITVTTTGGQYPSEEVKNKVLQKCSDKTVRPMNDRVFVYGPEIKEYDINLKYYTTESNESDAVTAIESEGGAIDEFIKWQSAKISRDINPDKLKALLIAAGAKRVDITAPQFVDLDVTDTDTSYSVYLTADAEKNIAGYVSAEGSADADIAANIKIYENPRLAGAYITTTENGLYKYTGDCVISPRGIGELAQFSGNLTVSHEVEGE